MGYLVASTQRSGSTMFCWLLEQTGIAGRPVTEHWNLGVERKAHEQQEFATYRDYLAHVRHSCTTPNGVFGANIMYRQMPLALARMRTVLGWEGLDTLKLWQQAFPGLNQFVFTYRQDVLAQAVSWARAHYTRQFTSEDVAVAEPKYDFWLIDTLYHDILAHNLAWETWFGFHGIRPLKVCYEHVVADPLGKLQETLSFLGLALPAGFRLAERFTPQGDGLNAEWRERWLSESRKRHVWVKDYHPG